jgi:membrane protease YdiL (CAAX protease family)
VNGLELSLLGRHDGDPSFDAVPHAKPYGWIGLPLSLIAILALGVAPYVVVAGLGYGLAVVLLGKAAGTDRAVSLFQAMMGDPHVAEFIALCFSILLYLTVAAAVLAVARMRAGARWRDLVAWHAWSVRRNSRALWIIAAATLAYSLVANEALIYFYPAAQNWVVLPTGFWSIAIFVILAVLFAPLTEELIFRGWIYTALRAKLALWPSLILSAGLFALAHWESTHLYALVVFPVGIALGLIRERTGSLKASMSFHAFYNGMACVMLVFGH